MQQMFLKKQKAKEKLEIIIKQKQRQTSLLRNILVLTLLTSIGIVGRTIFQFIPSVEPLIPLSIALSYFYGIGYGLFAGVVGFFGSNFLVWGGQGPWTIFQCIGAGLAAFIGAFIGKIPGAKSSRKLFIFACIGGTIVFELSVSAGWGLLFSVFNAAITTSIILLSLVTSLPFSLIHIGSSLGFGAIIYEFKDKLTNLIRKGDKIEYKISRIRHNCDNPGCIQRFVNTTIRVHNRCAKLGSIEYKLANKLWKWKKKQIYH